MGIATVCLLFSLLGIGIPGVLLLMGFGGLGLARMRTRKSKGKEKEKEGGEGEAGEDRKDNNGLKSKGATKDDADIDEDPDEDGGVRITEKVTGGAEKAGDAAAAPETKQGKKKKKTSACQFHTGRVINKVLFLLLINLRISISMLTYELTLPALSLLPKTCF